MTPKSRFNFIGRSGDENLYLVADDWFDNFIETVTEMVEQFPIENYAVESETPYGFGIMTDDNAPISCEIGSDKNR